MPAKKLHDSTVTRLTRQGAGPAEIAAAHDVLHGVRVTPEAVSMARLRRGDPPKWVRAELMPRGVLKVHANRTDGKMLRAESRRRRGEPLTPVVEAALNAWLGRLHAAREVVTYDRDTGWGRAPRQDGQDITAWTVST